MVRKCCVCERTDISPGFSFHKFPINDRQRKIWYKILGFKDDKILPKNALVCSDHFRERDFYYRRNSTKVLMKSANPMPYDGNLFGRSGDNNEDNNQSWKENIDFQNIAGPSGISELAIYSDQDSNSSSGNSSTTLTASETENIILTQLKEEPEKVINFVGTKSEFKGILRLVNHHKKRKRYIGDLSSDDFATPDEARRNYNLVLAEIKKLRSKVKMLQNTVSCLKLRITSLNQLIAVLKERSLITDSSETAMRASLSGIPAGTFEGLLKGPSTQKYNDTLWDFALTLSIYSPNAYEFVRNTFNKSLPHLRTISQWYRQRVISNKSLVQIS